MSDTEETKETPEERIVKQIELLVARKEELELSEAQLNEEDNTLLNQINDNIEALLEVLRKLRQPRNTPPTSPRPGTPETQPQGPNRILTINSIRF